MNTKLIEAVNIANHLLEDLIKTKENLVVAIDGPCGSGKTTFANELSKNFCCNVIPADNFFLRPFQRTEERLNTPGGNIDKERLTEEILVPLKNRQSFSYRPYDCKKGELSEPICVTLKSITIIEGSYSCHPELWDFYDLHIFIETDKNTQLQRLKTRNEKMFNRFLTEWIPLEEKYFSHFDIRNKCDLIFTL